MRQLLFILAIFLSGSALAQVDQSDRSNPDKHIGREKHSIGGERHHVGNRSIGKGFSTSKNDNKKMFGQPDKVKLDLNDDEDKVDMNKKSEFISPEMKFEPAYAKTGNDGKVKKEFSKPQDLGKFYTSGDFVKVSWRDAQVVDGDRVDIIVNGEVVAHNVTLLGQYHSMYVDLDKGFTKIEFQALNQGESGPNTADFKVEADDGSILVQNQWNLTTGTKAHLVVVKN